MKKFYWLLFFLTLFMGSTTKANTIVNKSDKVIKILEDNLSSFYKENANKQALFCGDIDSILEGDREGLYSFYLRKTKNDVQEKFKEEYKDYLEKHSVAKSVKELEEAYFFPYLYSIYIERPFVISRMIRKNVLNVIDHDIKYYKIAVTLMWQNELEYNLKLKMIIYSMKFLLLIISSLLFISCSKNIPTIEERKNLALSFFISSR